MKIIAGSIDVTKMDKDRFYKGKKGTYANITIRLMDDEDEYGNNGMIVESVSKEEREEGIRGAILGNVKVVFTDDDDKPAPKKAKAKPQEEYEEDPAMNDIPF